MKIMDVNRLDAHDRMEHFNKQGFNISECCENLIKSRPFGHHPFYIFAHTRTEEGQAGVKRLIWQPRLTKPKAQTNSMLFKAHPSTDVIKVIWMIPDPLMWKQYEPGCMTHSKIVWDSIQSYRFSRKELEAKEPDDLQDWQIDDIYKELSIKAHSQND